tara:strand:- start:277 stop:573 length:297 start_codon:yes stop_codon:yes gene_type:complete
MTDLITSLLTNGPIGIVAAVLLKMYIDEKKQSKERIEELNEKIQDILSTQAATLEKIYEKQNKREEEINQTLKDYGQSVIDAIDQTHNLAERIWNIRK